MVTYTVFDQDGEDMVAIVLDSEQQNSISVIKKADAPQPWLRDAQPGDMFDEQGNPTEGDDDEGDEE